MCWRLFKVIYLYTHFNNEVEFIKNTLIQRHKTDLFHIFTFQLNRNRLKFYQYKNYFLFSDISLNYYLDFRQLQYVGSK